MAERANPFSPGFSSRCAVSPVIAGEGVFMLHSFLLGVIITFIYDLFRIFRRIIPHGWFLLSLEDLVFWVLATAGIFYMLYYENNGMFRLFSVIGAGTGMFLYKKTLSAALVNLVSGAVNKLIALIGKILWKLSAPIRFLWRKMKVLAGRCARRAAREARIRRRQIKYRLTAWEKVIKMRLCKRREKRQSKRQNKEQAAKKLSGKKLRRGEAES